MKNQPSRFENMEKKRNAGREMVFIVVASIVLSAIVFFLAKSIPAGSYTLIGSIIVLKVFFIFKEKIKKSDEIKRMEEVFPDFIELVASNLRAGMTIDKALLLSSRKEFAPLDREILLLGKDIATGKEISLALIDLGKRTSSRKIQKTIAVITSGVKAGGNISVLLEETAQNSREKSFMEKKAASNVLMYIIFIFFAVSVGAPILFALSSILVSVLKSLLTTIPVTEMPQSMPFALTKVNLTIEFVMGSSIIFMTITSILASMTIGLVSKGEEKAGLKYAPILVALSIIIYFIVRTVLMSYFSDLFK
jgi:archaeal flagellar protein FlaJ